MNENKSSFWQLLEREHRAARAYCGRLSGNFEDGDDLYQDAIIRAHDGFGQLRSEESFRPWLYQIINNAFKSRVRNPWWRRVISGTHDLAELSAGDDPSHLYNAKRRLNYAFSVLSNDDRILVTLSELEGWKISELAQLLSRNEGFIKMRLSRARAKMRKKLESLHRGSTIPAHDQGIDKLCSATKPEED